MNTSVDECKLGGLPLLVWTTQTSLENKAKQILNALPPFVCTSAKWTKQKRRILIKQRNFFKMFKSKKALINLALRYKLPLSSHHVKYNWAEEAN